MARDALEFTAGLGVFTTDGDAELLPMVGPKLTMAPELLRLNRLRKDLLLGLGLGRGVGSLLGVLPVDRPAVLLCMLSDRRFKSDTRR